MSDIFSLSQNANIHECQSINTLLKYCSFNTTIIFDIDNTIFRPTHEEDLGSDQWFRKILELAFARTHQKPKALRSAIALSNAVQQHIKVKPVEPDTPHIIQVLQDLNLPTFAVTARRYDIAGITLNQLHDVSVQMSSEDGEVFRFQIDGKDVYFSQNVLFCDGADKGRCIAELLRIKSMTCGHILVLDDIRQNLEMVADAMEKLGIAFTGLRYSHLDDRVARFDLQRANAKLSSYSLFFSRSVANLVATFELETQDDSLRATTRPK